MKKQSMDWHWIYFELIKRYPQYDGVDIRQDSALEQLMRMPKFRQRYNAILGEQK